MCDQVGHSQSQEMWLLERPQDQVSQMGTALSLAGVSWPDRADPMGQVEDQEGN